MKTVTVEAIVPEVIVENYEFRTAETVTASTFKAAVSRAIGKILKRPQLHRKRYKQVSFSVTVNEAVKPVEPETQG